MRSCSLTVNTSQWVYSGPVGCCTSAHLDVVPRVSTSSYNACKQFKVFVSVVTTELFTNNIALVMFTFLNPHVHYLHFIVQCLHI